MPTIAIEQRLMESVAAWLHTPILAGNDPTGNLERARRVLCRSEILLREEERTITPEADQEKRARITLNATDNGRVKAYAEAIRIVRLSISVRANSKVPAGQSALLQEVCGALEKLLDAINLQTAWSSASFQISVMLANRAPGVTHRTEGDLRYAHYGVECRCVGLEHTV